MTQSLMNPSGYLPIKALFTKEGQAMTTCQYTQGCQNVGLHSCKQCNQKYCGDHTLFRPHLRWTPLLCVDCENATIAEDKRSNHGCRLLVISIALLGIGILLMYKSVENTIIATFGIVSIVTSIISISFIIWYFFLRS